MELQRIYDKNTGGSYFNLAGMRFGRWTVLERNGCKGGQPCWRCRCDCGNFGEEILSNALIQGKSQSCGCLRRELLSVNTRTHGQSKTRLYTAWTQMKDRCLNQNRRSWKRYGGRGIKVCQQWLDSFEQFATDVGPHPGFGFKLDRENNDGNYEPGNVRWVDDFVSSRNRSSAKLKEWKGQRRTLTEIALMEDVDYCTFTQKMAWPNSPIEQALDYCRKRGLTYRERAKGKRPPIQMQPDALTIIATSL